MAPALHPVSTRLRQEIDQHRYIPRGSLHELCSPQDIRSLLGLDGIDNRPKQISESYLKIFCLLLLLDKPDLILTCLVEEVDDAKIFPDWFEWETTERLLSECKVPLPVEIVSEQWRIPPALPKDSHRRFPPEYLDIIMGKKPERIGSGAFGKIYKIPFRKGFLQDNPQEQIVIVKKVTRKVDTPWNIIQNEFKIMRAKQHAALTHLLASFEAYKPGLTSEDIDLYLVLPYSTHGDMEKWIHQTATPSFLWDNGGREKRRSYLLSQILHLYSGLAYLHQQVDKSIVLHFDLKPANILLFDEASSPDPIWKISDFGTARFANVSQPENVVVDHDYTPPEFYDDQGRRNSEVCYGREFDTYSMGCIALQLLTLVCKGWDRGVIEEFDNRRRGSGEHKSFCKNPEAVQYWLEEQRREMTKDGIFIGILDLVGECLHREPCKRPFSWEMELYLHDLLNELEPLDKRRSDAKRIIQEPLSSDEIIYHDPIARAGRLGRDHIKNLLERAQWYDSNGIRPTLQRYESEISSSIYKTNLPHWFDSSELIGKTARDLVRSLGSAFDMGTKFAGVYGLGGTGKSHVAFNYAFQFRKKSGNPGRQNCHTFWINANDESSFMNSCQEICYKINPDSPEVSDPIMKFRMLLEEDKNWPWVLVLDGLDDYENAVKWQKKLPRAKDGRTIITSRNKEVLGLFTDFKKESTLSMPELTATDARMIFEQGASASDSETASERVSDDDIAALLSIVKTPLFLKLSATYLKRNEAGGITLKTLLEQLTNDIGDMRYLKVSGDQKDHSIEEGFYRVFSIILGPFEKQYYRKCRCEDACRQKCGEEFLLLGILSCFSSHNLDFKTISGFYQEEVEASRYISVYDNHSFITGSRCGKYVMHSLVSKLVLRYIKEHQELGPGYVLTCFEHMLQRIRKMYRDEPKISASGGQLVSPELDLRKLKYMPHFEEFLSYFRSLYQEQEEDDSLNDRKFNRDAVTSIIAFCRILESENRIEEAVKLLNFIEKQGIEEEKPKVSISLLSELARQYEAAASGREDKKALQQARDCAMNSLNKAKEFEYAKESLEGCLQLVRILTRLYEFPEARNQLDTLQRDLDMEKITFRGEEKKSVEIRIARQRAMITFHDGMANKKFDMVKTARHKLLIILSDIRDKWPHKRDLTIETEDKIVLVDAEIPDTSSLGQAEHLLQQSLERQKKQHPNNPRHNVIAKTELRLAIVWMRQEKLEQTIECLEKLMSWKTPEFNEYDWVTRAIAYYLRECYRRLGYYENAETVESKFPGKELRSIMVEGAVKNSGIWFTHSSNFKSTTHQLNDSGRQPQAHLPRTWQILGCSPCHWLPFEHKWPTMKIFLLHTGFRNSLGVVEE